MNIPELINALVELYRRTACILPRDVIDKIVESQKAEYDPSPASETLSVILDNAKIAQKEMLPLCQDTGTPIFQVYIPKRWSSDMQTIREAIITATRIATEKIPLRPNSVDSLTGRNTGDNIGVGAPIIHFEDHDGQEFRFCLMLKGGGSENIGRLYSLPDERLSAERNIDGVRRCILDAVNAAQGKGCPPMIVGVGVSGSRDSAIALAKKQLFRNLDDANPKKELALFERRMCEEINSLGIGPMGLGGKSTALGVKIDFLNRHPATFFVDVSFSCWACRRAALEVNGDELRFTQ